ncbi:MAG: hypothetical protein D6772_15865, partial [Bacteroidetes bacterium]
QIEAQQRSRYRIMQRFRWHIIAYALLAAIAAAYFFFSLSAGLRWWLLFPCAVALAYVLPLLNGQRLRDFPYIKIFLIALSWAWLTVFGPVWEAGGTIADERIILMAIERAAFIFAITIPFDIRDMGLDAAHRLHTLPGVFGVATAKRWAYICLLLMGLVASYLALTGFYQPWAAAALLVSALSTAWIVRQSTPDRHDYYFTGLVDGTMIMQAALLYLMDSLS